MSSTRTDFLQIVQTVILAQVAARPPGRRVDIRESVQTAISHAVEASHMVPAGISAIEAAEEYLESFVYEDGTAEAPNWLTPGYRSLR
jgi:hypothetical protein